MSLVLRQWVSEARNVVIFTGAGMSTDSGIPDFRSPGGVWSRMAPIMFQDFIASEENRIEAWRRKFAMADELGKSFPNDGHKAIAKLVADGKVSAVITQNIDNLHQDSGIEDDKIIELHGNGSYAVCLDCDLRHELDAVRGQAMPEAQMKRAEVATLTCDLFIAIGSSLQVYPAAGFPALARHNGARLVILNREATELDSTASLVLNEEITPTLVNLTSLDS